MNLQTFVFLVWAAAISPRAPADASTDFLPPAPAAKEWKLVWQDEFDGAKLDESKWNRLGDSKRRHGFWIKDDAFLNGKGQLILRTRKDGERFTCGALNTQGKFEHAFGYYVARCTLPTQPGHWPAFWLMSKGVNQVGDDGRDGTEIDIIEIPWRHGRLASNLHWDGYGKMHKSAGTKFSIPAVTNGLHTFSLLWQPAEYVFYVDGNEVGRSAAGGVSQQPKDLILCDWHYEELAKYPGKPADYGSIPFPLEQGFRVWPGGWKNVPATEALLNAERKHQQERLLGHLCTTWGAVKIRDLAEWPPIRAATKK